MAKIAGIGNTAPKRKVRRPQPAPRSEVAAAGGVGRPKQRPVYGPPTPKVSPVAGPRPQESKYYPAKVRKATRKQYAQIYGHQPTGAYERGIARGTVAGPSVAESKTVVRRGQRAKQAAQTVQSLAARQRTTGNFQPQDVRNAIASGLAPNIHEGAHGVFLVKQKRRFLPDAYMPVAPKGVSQAKVFDAAGVQEQSAAYRAPVLKVLEQTVRPIHGIAGAASAAAEGKSIGHAAGQGFLHNKPYSFSRVLKDVGAPKGVQKVGGFAGDVLLDPTTYVTFGAGSLAEHAAAQESARVAAKAAEAGMSEQGVRTVAARAGQRAAANAKSGKALTVRFGSRGKTRAVPGTAAVSRGVKATPLPKVVRRAGTHTREIAGEFRPTLTPAGANPESYVAGRQAARSSRSFTQHHIADTDAEARGLQAQIPEAQQAAVFDAIEKGRVVSLADNYAEVKAARKAGKHVKPQGDVYHAAVKLRSVYRYANRLRKRAGTPEGTIDARRKVQVPTVTADAEASRQRLNAAIRDLKAQERTHQDSLAGFGVARGRAQILSRNVGGTTAERRAQALTTTGNQFAGGGHGVRQAAAALQAGARNVAKARERVRQIQAEHDAVVAAARGQRVARGQALKAQERRTGAAVSYLPHAQQTPLYEGLGIVDRPEDAPTFTGALRRPGSSRRREDLRPVSAQNPERVAAGKDPYSTDIPLVHANYGRQTAKAVGAGQLEQRLAAIGRVVKPKIVPVTRRSGKTIHHRDYGHVQPAANEAIYHAGYAGKGSAFSLREISPKDWAAGNVPKTGKIVIADRKAVEAARQYAKPTQATSATGRTVDQITRGFKGLATFTPGFHARNAVGDTQMGYLKQPGQRIAPNMAEASKAVHGLAGQRRAVESLAFDTTPKGTIRVAGQDMPVTDFIKLAREHGVDQSGQVTRELADLGGSAVHGLKKTGAVRRGARKVGRAVGQNRVVKALTQDRENLVRFATFKHGLDTGLDAGAAADLAMSAHIDYADLTEVERKYARRLMPFYTFSARALPLHVKALVQTPGKFANIEKARERIGGTDASGYSPWSQRQVPFNVGKSGVTDSLPLTVLNEVPTTKQPGAYADEIAQFAAGLINPIFRDPAELYANRSFTFRNQIQDPNHPLVNAPNWVGSLPTGVRKQLGVVKGKTGRWMWHGKADYALRAVALGPFNVANQLGTSGSNRIGQGATAKAVAGLTGVRVQPQDKVTQQINQSYNDLNSLTEKQRALGQQGINAKNPTPAYSKLKAQIHAKEVQIYNLSKKRGDKVLPKAGAPSRARGGGSVGGGFGGFGSGFGGGFK